MANPRRRATAVVPVLVVGVEKSLHRLTQVPSEERRTAYSSVRPWKATDSIQEIEWRRGMLRARSREGREASLNWHWMGNQSSRRLEKRGRTEAMSLRREIE